MRSIKRVKKLGSGAQGTVYEIEDLNENRKKLTLVLSLILTKSFICLKIMIFLIIEKL
jgi:hypothetical protein